MPGTKSMDLVNSITIEALTIGTIDSDQQEWSVPHLIIKFYNYTFGDYKKSPEKGVQMHVCFCVSII